MKRLAMCGCILLMLALDLTGFTALAAIPVPYLENFDSCVPPALPAGWITVETQASNSFAYTQANNSHSAPNKVILYEGQSADFVVLAMPPVDDEYPFQQISVWWWARSYRANSSLQVGVLQDPDDPNSFFSLTADIQLSSFWRQYHLSMALYPGSNGRRIAFKSAEADYGGILIDDVELLANHAVDLELSELQCYDPYRVSELQDYSARVINQGNSNVYGYDCQLLDGNGNILAQIGNNNIGPGYLAGSGFDYAISTPGNHRLSARVICPGDTNPDNDNSAARIVRILPDGAQEQAAPYLAQYHHKYPIDLYWKTSLSETLYPYYEMFEEDTLIWGLKYWAEIISPDIGIKPIKIWMGYTDLPDLVSGWVLASELQLVFDGENSFPPGNHSSYFCFSEPFHYQAGRNLVIMVFRPMDFRYYTSMDDFYCDYTTIHRTRKLQSDTAIYDPNSVYGGELSTARPVTFFIVGGLTSPSDDPVAEANILNPVAYPNPFNPSTTISFSIPAGMQCSLDIYNLRGQKVKTLLNENMTAGKHSVVWDGDDDNGRKVSSGVYLYRLSTPFSSKSAKMLLMK
ncbi:MAG: FlgD immunoglobulin-like domain containing protein [Candidatus Cloacimonadaceae bacterium]|nr:FlgD immunoglobulin-like domain containing protein [Candidatus Cloacimonadaceae bacterium]